MSVVGVDFLKDHPETEEDCGLDTSHVIVHRQDWQYVVKFFSVLGLSAESVIYISNIDDKNKVERDAVNSILTRIADIQKQQNSEQISQHQYFSAMDMANVRRYSRDVNGGIVPYVDHVSIVKKNCLFVGLFSNIPKGSWVDRFKTHILQYKKREW